MKQREFIVSSQNMPQLMIYLEALIKEGKTPQVTIKEKVSGDKRSLEANKFLWGKLYKSISQFTGYLPMEVHLLCGHLFLCEQKTINGVQVPYVRSTSDLTIEEFTFYIQNIESYFAQLGWSMDE
jgi:hypothetical protein